MKRATRKDPIRTEPDYVEVGREETRLIEVGFEKKVKDNM